MRVHLASFFALLLLFPGSLQAEANERGKILVLNAGNSWRKYYTFYPPRLSLASAHSKGVQTDLPTRTSYFAGKFLSGMKTSPPPENWVEPDFDDSDWLRLPGADLTGHLAALGKRAKLPKLPAPDPKLLPHLRGVDTFIKELGLVSMRGKFHVKSRWKVRKLWLSLSYRGGFVAYLNGKEIARASLPQGGLDPSTAADDYPLAAFLPPKDKALKPYSPESPWLLRERRFGPVEIKKRYLQKGLNVLAINLHRSDFPAECKDKGFSFSPIGLAELSLEARASENAISAIQERDGLHARTEPVWREVFESDQFDSVEQSQQIRIAAARNGTFSGQIVIGSAGAIQNLQLGVGTLKQEEGDASIPNSQIVIHYGSLNPLYSKGTFSWITGLSPARFDALLDKPPARIEPTKSEEITGWGEIVRNSLGLPERPAQWATIPIWISVQVPKDVRPGVYSSAVTIQVEGAQPMIIPLEVTVADWTLPDREDYTSLMFLYQSPDTLAKYYKIEPWSEAHWKLIEKSLKLMGEAGNIGLIFSLLAESQMGNAESMVTWIKQPGGTFKHDFTVFDRYLETALKFHHTERLKVISLNVWGWEVMRRDSFASVTALDPKTGKREPMKLPEYGSPECEDFWHPVLTRIYDRLRKKGLENKVMLGIPADDADPHPAHVAMFRNILPDVPWHREAHFEKNAYVYDIADRHKKVPVGCTSLIWNAALPDPLTKRLYGWQYKPTHLALNFNRFGSSQNLFGFPEPWDFQTWMETTLICGRNGNGRVGVDYFRLTPAADFPRGAGYSAGTLFNRYPRSNVHNLSLGTSTTDLFAPIPDGPVTTIRFENALEGNQQSEARIFIEKAMVQHKKLLTAKLARRCRDLLDERTNIMRTRSTNYFDIWHDTRRGSTPFGAQNWRKKNQQLFDLAGDVQRALQATP